MRLLARMSVRRRAVVSSPRLTSINPRRVRLARLLALMVMAVMGLWLSSCGGTPSNTVLLTFFESPIVTPLVPVAGQNYVVNFGIENADEQQSVITNVQYTVTRNNTLVVSSTVPLLTAHVPISINYTDNQQSGIYSYVLTIDPNHLVPQISTTLNTEIFQVQVLPLTVM